MRDTDDVMQLAMDRWGPEAVAWAVEDLAGAAPYPALVVLANASAELGCKGWWDDEGPDDAMLIALRACQHHHAREFIGPLVGDRGRDHGSELVAWFEQDLQDAYFDLLPEATCLCGQTYKVVPEFGRNWHTFIPVEGGKCLTDRGEGTCRCGRLLSKIGMPEQQTLALELAGC